MTTVIITIINPKGIPHAGKLCPVFIFKTYIIFNTTMSDSFLYLLILPYLALTSERFVERVKE